MYTSATRRYTGKFGVLWGRDRDVLSRPFHLIVSLSRASAAVLSTVLMTTTLSNGNMRFSGTCQTEIPKPINMKFCTIDYVGKVMRYANNGWNRLAGGGGGPTDRWKVT
jgi:hypothetical protein